MSDNVYPIPGLDDLQENLERLKSGDGGGTFDGMEARVTRLEDKMDKVDGRLTSIEVTLARIEEKLDSKPGHWAVLALNATLLGLVLAAIGFGARVL
ncbi:hypothetical protein PXK58_09005 [Phaeobacter gallaeciensis]|uniref:hypothetical protein n=1 Tax=Phaeobacter gallaeciensis TaxID=60890 RepID=UPI002380A947|nr:hypothetical protein [Phaeobacter gallaeciensis]MDE4274736.1 hypothetical protein [Phaeobacter gallaeciensis]MDE4299690.1 hypothetical protein [Phaeobacter gallaeciensis]MDE5184855.1 hypothetical protein [Phaeobacter gallaeciensis]